MPVVRHVKKPQLKQQRVQNKRECPLCYSPTSIVGVGCGVSMRCPSGCLDDLVGIKTTEAEAIEEYNKFLKELEMGSEMWGSKIKSGLGDD